MAIATSNTHDSRSLSKIIGNKDRIVLKKIFIYDESKYKSWRDYNKAIHGQSPRRKGYGICRCTAEPESTQKCSNSYYLPRQCKRSDLQRDRNGNQHETARSEYRDAWAAAEQLD